MYTYNSISVDVFSVLVFWSRDMLYGWRRADGSTTVSHDETTKRKIVAIQQYGVNQEIKKKVDVQIIFPTAAAFFLFTLFKIIIIQPMWLCYIKTVEVLFFACSVFFVCVKYM